MNAVGFHFQDVNTYGSILYLTNFEERWSYETEVVFLFNIIFVFVETLYLKIKSILLSLLIHNAWTAYSIYF